MYRSSKESSESETRPTLQGQEERSHSNSDVLSVKTSLDQPSLKHSEHSVHCPLCGRYFILERLGTTITRTLTRNKLALILYYGISSYFYWFAAIHRWCRGVQLSRWWERQHEAVCFILDVEMEGLVGKKETFGSSGENESSAFLCRLTAFLSVCETGHLLHNPSLPKPSISFSVSFKWALSSAVPGVMCLLAVGDHVTLIQSLPPLQKKEKKTLHTGSSWGVGVEGASGEMWSSFWVIQWCLLVESAI